MKKFILIFLFLFTGLIYSQEVPKNHATSLLLGSEPEVVEDIVEFASDKWNDKAAIEYEVEKQSYCYIMVMAKIQDINTTPTEHLIIRSELMKEAIASDSETFEKVDWFRLYRNINHKIKK